MAQDADIQDSDSARILVANHTGEVWLGDYVKLQADALDAICGGAIARSKDHAAIVVKRDLVF